MKSFPRFFMPGFALQLSHERSRLPNQLRVAAPSPDDVMRWTRASPPMTPRFAPDRMK